MNGMVLCETGDSPPAPPPHPTQPGTSVKPQSPYLAICEALERVEDIKWDMAWFIVIWGFSPDLESMCASTQAFVYMNIWERNIDYGIVGSEVSFDLVF